MKKLFIILLCVAVMVTTFSCATNRQTGALTGGSIGAMIGALAWQSNSWVGLLIGATAGALVGYVLGDINDQQEKAKTEAASTGRRVFYYNDKDQAVESVPGPLTKTIYENNQRTDCRKVTTRIFENGGVVSDKTEEVCTATKSSATY
jgi:phage tail tape-measure protein